jgi:hypothetical protein
MRIMRKFLLAMALVGFIAGVPAQSFAVSEYVLPWLLFSMGARASGMGGAQMTEASGADAVYWNPALLGFLPGRAITGMHFAPVPDLTDDVYFEYASYAQKVESWGGGVGGNLMFLTYGQSTATDPSGLVIQDFSSWEMGLGLGYGAALSQKIAVGGGVKFLMSRLSPKIDDLEEGQGETWAIDVGMHARNIGPMGLRAGFGWQNMGPALKFIDNGSPNPLPLNFRLGVGFNPFKNDTHVITVAADMNKVLVHQEVVDGQLEVDPAWKAIVTAWTDESFSDELEDAVYNLGAEYAFSNFLFIRGGWVQDQLGDITDFTYGAGVSYARVRFDFAGYPQATGLDDVKRFSVSYDF